MIKFILLWTLGAFLLFAVLEMTIPAGSQLKKWPRRVLMVIYLPLYAVALILMALHKTWIFLQGSEEGGEIE